MFWRNDAAPIEIIALRGNLFKGKYVILHTRIIYQVPYSRIMIILAKKNIIYDIV